MNGIIYGHKRLPERRKLLTVDEQRHVAQLKGEYVPDDEIDEFTYKSAVTFFVWGFFIFFIVTVLLVVYLHYGPKAI